MDEEFDVSLLNKADSKEEVKVEDGAAGKMEGRKQVPAAPAPERRKTDFLKKTILEQAQGLVYESVCSFEREFDKIFTSIMSQFHNWELFDDKEISLACQALRELSASNHIFHVSQSKNISKLLIFFEGKEIPPLIRSAVVESFM